MNKVIFRADANPDIGLGHIMRCLSIADSFREVGWSVSFILADDIVEEYIKKRGYDSVVLNSDYFDMESELKHWNSLSKWAAEDEVDRAYVIIDSYYVTETYLRKIKQILKNKNGKKIHLIYIDDLASFPYPVDILINYNAYAESIDYNSLYGNKTPCLLLGTEYTPLRREFRGAHIKKQKRKIENVLISTGGSDTEHLTIQIIEEIIRYSVKKSDVEGVSENCKFHILIGALNIDRDRIYEMAKKQSDIVVHENVVDMKSLISKMDICASAAGSTLYEICACGVPLITYSMADNQIPGAEAFEKLGLAVNIGDIRKMNSPAKELSSAIFDLSRKNEKRIEMGYNMQNMIDGLGAEKMVKMLNKMIVVM